MKRLHVLLNLSIKHDENFSTLEAMHKYMKEKATNQKKKRADDSSEEEYVKEEE